MLYNILLFTSFILDESIHISKISVEIFEYDKYCYIYPHKQKLWGFSKISNIQRGLGTKLWELLVYTYSLFQQMSSLFSQLFQAKIFGIIFRYYLHPFPYISATTKACKLF